MATSLHAARAILALSKDHDSWKFILEKKPAFIWTDDEDSVGRWNEITADSKLPRVEHRLDTSGRLDKEFLTYKGRSVEIPLTDSREDPLIVLHTLARLVREDSDIRFCLDSWHSSDLAFLPLATADWKALEKEFGEQAVAYRFLAFPQDLEEFTERAFSDENNRHYPSDIPDHSAEEQMARELSDYIKELVKPHCPSAEVYCELELDLTRVLRVKIRTKTDDERDALSDDSERREQIVAMAKKRCAEHDIWLTMVYIQSYESVNRDSAGDWSWGMIAGRRLHGMTENEWGKK